MVNNLLQAHEEYLSLVRKVIEITDKNKDAGTNDLLANEVLRMHELELWFIRSCLATK